MKWFFSFVLTFLFIIIGYGQIQSGKVVYKIDPPSLEEAVDKDRFAESSRDYIMDFINTRLKALNYVELELIFNSFESYMNTDKFMNNDTNPEINGGLGVTNTYGVYYNNIEEDIFYHQHSEFNKLYLVTSDFDSLDWEIHDETKEILGYTCIKATTTIVEPRREFPTTVWFAPELPFPFGPKEFRGLPGVILAMNYNNYYFYAVSIDLNKNKNNIKKPTKGELVTDKRFFKIVEEYHNNIFKNR